MWSYCITLDIRCSRLLILSRLILPAFRKHLEKSLRVVLHLTSQAKEPIIMKLFKTYMYNKK